MTGKERTWPRYSRPPSSRARARPRHATAATRSESRSPPLRRPADTGRALCVPCPTPCAAATPQGCACAPRARALARASAPRARCPALRRAPRAVSRARRWSALARAGSGRVAVASWAAPRRLRTRRLAAWPRAGNPRARSGSAWWRWTPPRGS